VKRRSATPPQRYERLNQRMYAIDPQAFLELFIAPASRENEMIGDTCIVEVCGPLDQHDSGWCDSYEAIRKRFAEACESNATAIVMRVESPGGDVAGCFDTVKAIRAMCEAARKPLYAYCERACSAGYALASAASFVVMSETSTVGSIGCLQSRPDYSAQNAMQGVRFAFVTSGARKVDGHPDSPITDDEIKATQEIIDAVAGVFFALVESTRGIKAADVAALQAGVFHAEAARERRLVDDVMSFESLLAQIAGGGLKMAAEKNAYEEARAALEKAAEGDDANAAAAKRALAAMNVEPAGDDEDEEESDDELAVKADDDEPKVEGGGDEPGDKPKKPAAAEPDDKKPEASTHAIALKALAEVHELRAERTADKSRAERRRLLDSRKDFAAELRSELMKASTPIETVRSMVKTLKRGKDIAATTAAPAAAAPTRGAGQGAPDTSGSDPRAVEQHALDVGMGLTQQTLGVVRRGANRLEFGIVDKPVEAAAPPSGAAGGVK